MNVRHAVLVAILQLASLSGRLAAQTPPEQLGLELSIRLDLPDTVETTPNANGVEVNGGDADDSIELYSPVFVIVTLASTRNDPQKFISSLSDQGIDLVVTDESGKAVPVTRYGMRLDLAKTQSPSKEGPYGPVTLAARGTTRDRVNVSRRFDITTKGLYFVQAFRPVKIGIGKGSRATTLESNRLKIRIGESGSAVTDE